MDTRTGPDYANIFHVLADLIEIGILVVNPQGNVDFASDRARALLGCADGLDIETCHPEAAAVIRDLLTQFKVGGVRTIQQEICIETSEGTRRVSFSIHPLEEEDCDGYLVEVKDVDSMRRMATDLRMAAQFRNTRRLLQALVEDLKQPLSAMMLHVDLLRTAVSSQKSEGESQGNGRSLDVIRRQVTDLDRAITLMLEEMAPSDGEEQGLSLRDVLSDVVRVIEPQAFVQNVEVVRRDDGNPARLTGSRQRLKQAVLNLAVNALDAMPGGGVLTFDLRVDDRDARLRIGDTGQGIPDNVLPHIFEMHFTTKRSGTGVGLYVAREVIERHQGSIDVVSSSSEGGTTFEVALPVHDAAY